MDNFAFNLMQELWIKVNGKKKKQNMYNIKISELKANPISLHEARVLIDELDTKFAWTEDELHFT